MKLFGLLISLSLLLVSACSFVNNVPTPTALSRADDSELYKDPYPSLTQVPQTAPQGYTPNRQAIGNTLAADQANAARAAQQPLGPIPTAPNTYRPPAAPTTAYSNRPTALTNRPSADALLAERRTQAGGFAPPTTGGTQYAPPQSAGAPTQSLQRPNIAPIQPIQAVQSGQVQRPQIQQAAAQQPAPRITPPAFVKPDGQKIAVIYFGHASSEISENDTHVLLNVAAYHKKQGGKLVLVGHASAATNAADQRAALEANGKMSVKRVEAVGGMLLRMGIGRDKIDADARAAFDAGSSDREARRVDVYHVK